MRMRYIKNLHIETGAPDNGIHFMKYSIIRNDSSFFHMINFIIEKVNVGLNESL